MDLIVDKMVKLQEIHITDRNGVIKLLAGTSVIKDGLAVLTLSIFSKLGYPTRVPRQIPGS